MDKKMNNGKKTVDGIEFVLFSWLSLGAKFKYPNRSKIWIKISHDLSGGCIAEWNENKQDIYWVGQSICSLNDDDIDQYVLLVN